MFSATSGPSVHCARPGVAWRWACSPPRAEPPAEPPAQQACFETFRTEPEKGLPSVPPAQCVWPGGRGVDAQWAGSALPAGSDSARQEGRRGQPAPQAWEPGPSLFTSFSSRWSYL